MRLNMEAEVVGSGAVLLTVTGIIDWSTIGQFQVAMGRYASHPRPDLLLDLTGLLSWCPEAQAVLERTTTQARLHGGRVVAFGLAAIPIWEATGSGLPGLELAP